MNKAYISEKETPMSVNKIKFILKEQNLIQKPIDTIVERYWPGDKEQKS